LQWFCEDGHKPNLVFFDFQQEIAYNETIMNGEGKKLGLVGKVIRVAIAVASLFSGGAKLANAQPNMKTYNFSDNSGVKGAESVLISEGGSNSPYNEIINNPSLRMYIKDSNDNNWKQVGIGLNSTLLAKLFLVADVGVPNGANNYLKVMKSTEPINTEKRNVFIRQDPNNLGADSNCYDVLDLTDKFTNDAKINLSPITSSTPRKPVSYAQWNEIFANYADIYPKITDGNLPDGKVDFRDFAVLANNWKRTDCNSTNHWCDYSDLNRDNNVNEYDLGLFSEQWLCDPNTIK
jgi:hypothetical protein